MATVHVSLPDALRDWVEAQGERGRYDSVSDHVSDLIRQDQERSDGAALRQSLITEGFDSGISASSLDDVIAEARERTRAAQRP